MNSLGFVWDTFKTQWENWVSLFEKFVEKEGHAIVPYSHKTEEYQLGHWFSNQRRYKDQLSNEQKSKLDALGFVSKVK